MVEFFRQRTRRRNFLRPLIPPSMQATPSEPEAGGESPQSCVSEAHSDWTAGKPVSLLAPLIPPRSAGQPLTFGPSGRQPLRSLLVGICSGSGRRRSSQSPMMRPGTGAERGGLMVSEMESHPPAQGPGDGERRLSGSSLCSSSWVSADGFLRRRPSVRDRSGTMKNRDRKLSPKEERERRKSSRWDVLRRREMEGGGCTKGKMRDPGSFQRARRRQMRGGGAGPARGERLGGAGPR